MNNKGNEIADRAAKTGSKLPPTQEIKCGKAHVKKTINDHMYSEWDRRWQTLPNCRQAFFFYRYVDRSKAKRIMKLNRHELGILIRYTTGHAHLRRHNKITGTSLPMSLTRPEPRYSLDDPEETNEADDEEIRCRLCKLKGKEETPIHIFRDCLAPWQTRWSHLGHYTFEKEEYVNWEPTQLVGYFRKLDLENQLK